MSLKVNGDTNARSSYIRSVVTRESSLVVRIRHNGRGRLRRPGREKAMKRQEEIRARAKKRDQLYSRIGRLRHLGCVREPDGVHVLNDAALAPLAVFGCGFALFAGVSA
jgi:hypothetical protein